MAGGIKEALQMIGDSGLPFYVYVMRRPDGTPFYVGKGMLDRVACHERHALRAHHDGLRLRIIRAIWERTEMALFAEGVL